MCECMCAHLWHAQKSRMERQGSRITGCDAANGSASSSWQGCQLGLAIWGHCKAFQNRFVSKRFFLCVRGGGMFEPGLLYKYLRLGACKTWQLCLLLIPSPWEALFPAVNISPSPFSKKKSVLSTAAATPKRHAGKKVSHFLGGESSRGNSGWGKWLGKSKTFQSLGAEVVTTQKKRAKKKPSTKVSFIHIWEMDRCPQVSYITYMGNGQMSSLLVSSLLLLRSGIVVVCTKKKKEEQGPVFIFPAAKVKGWAQGVPTRTEDPTLGLPHVRLRN